MARCADRRERELLVQREVPPNLPGGGGPGPPVGALLLTEAQNGEPVTRPKSGYRCIGVSRVEKDAETLGGVDVAMGGVREERATFGRRGRKKGPQDSLDRSDRS